MPSFIKYHLQQGLPKTGLKSVKQIKCGRIDSKLIEPQYDRQINTF